MSPRLGWSENFRSKTAPALSSAYAPLIRSKTLPDDLLGSGITAQGPVAGPAALRYITPQPKRGSMTIQRFDNAPRFCRVLSHNGTVYLAGMTADGHERRHTPRRPVRSWTRSTTTWRWAGSNKSQLLTAMIWLRDNRGFRGDERRLGRLDRPSGHAGPGHRRGAPRGRPATGVEIMVTAAG